MRIERLQHAADGAVHEPVGVDLLDVSLLDRLSAAVNTLYALRQAVLGRQHAAAEEPADEGREGDTANAAYRDGTV